MIGTIEEIVQWLLKQDREKIFNIKEYKKKRSLSQNAYAWLLIGKIADAVRLSKEDVYLRMLEDYGQSEIISIKQQANIKGYFKYIKKIGVSELNGEKFTHYKIFKGSSDFDSTEMSVFIDGIIQECHNLDIETMTKEEIERLKLI